MRNFCKWDTDGDTLVSYEDLKCSGKACEALTEEDQRALKTCVFEMMEAADRDGDGRVAYDEFFEKPQDKVSDPYRHSHNRASSFKEGVRYVLLI